MASRKQAAGLGVVALCRADFAAAVEEGHLYVPHHAAKDAPLAIGLHRLRAGGARLRSRSRRRRRRGCRGRRCRRVRLGRCRRAAGRRGRLTNRRTARTAAHGRGRSLR
eukprot:13650804-Alexandrium_andersonii.AAC.1